MRITKLNNNLSKLTEKISHKYINSKFEKADEVLGTSKGSKLREKVIRKSFALTRQDLEKINIIKDRCLNQKVVLNDSHVIRMSINLAIKLTENELIKSSLEVPKVFIGRPKIG